MSCLPKEKKSIFPPVCVPVWVGYEEHRDVHGVRNILNKALHGAFKHWNVQMNLTYLRIA
ncbi:hypothetical protein B4119_2462 [Parageobacillus caldoxylosilyticus]|uniref:Uncharacterized protein n=1 Tax=Saccharococcus caldoxylosilyticus TaxID=81408 RepID=A0A150KW53_9BACL|nr:hypothetical protein B4119_2462 [Parageobacillus caldoxylosilyticus]